MASTSISASNKSESKPKELLGIQHLRGIAAVLVLLSHIDGMSRFPKYFNFDVFPGMFSSGPIGVHLFFVISGFIIPYVSLKEGSLQPLMNASTFLRRRFIRIIPFMWACIIGYALLRLLGRGTFPFIPYLRAFTLFPIGEVNPEQVWTLRHEFLFYSLYCIAILSFARKQWIMMACWFLSPFLWYLVDSFANFQKDTAGYELCTFFFSKYNLFFGLGFLIGIFHIKGNQRNWKTKHGFLVSLFSAIPLILCAHFFGVDPREIGFDIIMLLGVLALGSVLVGISIQSPEKLNLLDRIGLKLGDASYSIYLTHTAFVSALLGIWSKVQPSAPYPVVIALGTVFAVIGGILVHLYVEKPVIKLAQRLFAPKKKVFEPAPAPVYKDVEKPANG